MALRFEKLSFLLHVAHANICGSFGRYYHESEVPRAKICECLLRIPSFRFSNKVTEFNIDLSTKSNKSFSSLALSIHSD